MHVQRDLSESDGTESIIPVDATSRRITSRNTESRYEDNNIIIMYSSPFSDFYEFYLLTLIRTDEINCLIKIFHLFCV